ncbi:sensor histidine kinase [Fibrella arboris]|uniref:sensor histidine kinase n=1 Tax=Fibrella arboris TaxID=3242486 RepID=UPI003522BF38
MEDNLYLVVIVSTIVFLVLAVFIVSFLLLFQRRQLQNLKEKIEMKIAYEQEILQVQIEVQNQTLQQVGNDLHDNIGQLLSLTKLHLNSLEEENDPEWVANRMLDVRAIVDLAIREVRSLTKSLDKEFIEQFGLIDSLQHELDRLEQTGRFTTEFSLTGNQQSLGFQREIILFRVVQEILNNAIKHAQANRIAVAATFSTSLFTLQISDDGQGFDIAELQNRELGTSGAGLRTMQRRAELIGGTCQIMSIPTQGTQVMLTLPITQPE